jgi:hypothetical protein
MLAETASLAIERDSLQQKSLQLESKVKELADIVLSQGRDLEGSLQVIDNAVERTEVEHLQMKNVLNAERAAASLLLDSALRDRDALHKAALAEKERWYDSKIEELQMAAGLSNSKLRQAHEQNRIEMEKLQVQFDEERAKHKSDLEAALVSLKQSHAESEDAVSSLRALQQSELDSIEQEHATIVLQYEAKLAQVKADAAEMVRITKDETDLKLQQIRDDADIRVKSTVEHLTLVVDRLQRELSVKSEEQELSLASQRLQLEAEAEAKRAALSKAYADSDAVIQALDAEIKNLRTSSREEMSREATAHAELLSAMASAHDEALKKAHASATRNIEAVTATLRAEAAADKAEAEIVKEATIASLSKTIADLQNKISSLETSTTERLKASLTETASRYESEAITTRMSTDQTIATLKASYTAEIELLSRKLADRDSMIEQQTRALATTKAEAAADYERARKAFDTERAAITENFSRLASQSMSQADRADYDAKTLSILAVDQDATVSRLKAFHEQEMQSLQIANAEQLEYLTRKHETEASEAEASFNVKLEQIRAQQSIEINNLRSQITSAVSKVEAATHNGTLNIGDAKKLFDESLFAVQQASDAALKEARASADARVSEVRSQLLDKHRIEVAALRGKLISLGSSLSSSTTSGAGAIGEDNKFQDIIAVITETHKKELASQESAHTSELESAKEAVKAIEKTLSESRATFERLVANTPNAAAVAELEAKVHELVSELTSKEALISSLTLLKDTFEADLTAIKKDFEALSISSNATITELSSALISAKNASESVAKSASKIDATRATSYTETIASLQHLHGANLTMMRASYEKKAAEARSLSLANERDLKAQLAIATAQLEILRSTSSSSTTTSISSLDTSSTTANESKLQAQVNATLSELRAKHTSDLADLRASHERSISTSLQSLVSREARVRAALSADFDKAAADHVEAMNALKTQLDAALSALSEEKNKVEKLTAEAALFASTKLALEASINDVKTQLASLVASNTHWSKIAAERDALIDQVKRSAEENLRESHAKFEQEINEAQHKVTEVEASFVTEREILLLKLDQLKDHHEAQLAESRLIHEAESVTALQNQEASLNEALNKALEREQAFRQSVVEETQAMKSAHETIINTLQSRIDGTGATHDDALHSQIEALTLEITHLERNAADKEKVIDALKARESTLESQLHKLQEDFKGALVYASQQSQARREAADTQMNQMRKLNESNLVILRTSYEKQAAQQATASEARAQAYERALSELRAQHEARIAALAGEYAANARHALAEGTATINSQRFAVDSENAERHRKEKERAAAADAQAHASAIQAIEGKHAAQIALLIDQYETSMNELRNENRMLEASIQQANNAASSTLENQRTQAEAVISSLEMQLLHARSSSSKAAQASEARELETRRLHDFEVQVLRHTEKDRQTQAAAALAAAAATAASEAKASALKEIAELRAALTAAQAIAQAAVEAGGVTIPTPSSPSKVSSSSSSSSIIDASVIVDPLLSLSSTTSTESGAIPLVDPSVIAESAAVVAKVLALETQIRSAYSASQSAFLIQTEVTMKEASERHAKELDEANSRLASREEALQKSITELTNQLRTATAAVAAASAVSSTYSSSKEDESSSSSESKTLEDEKKSSTSTISLQELATPALIGLAALSEQQREAISLQFKEIKDTINARREQHLLKVKSAEAFAAERKASLKASTGVSTITDVINASVPSVIKSSSSSSSSSSSTSSSGAAVSAAVVSEYERKIVLLQAQAASDLAKARAEHEVEVTRLRDALKNALTSSSSSSSAVVAPVAPPPPSSSVPAVLPPVVAAVPVSSPPPPPPQSSPPPPPRPNPSPPVSPSSVPVVAAPVVPVSASTSFLVKKTVNKTSTSGGDSSNTDTDETSTETETDDTDSDRGPTMRKSLPLSKPISSSASPPARAPPPPPRPGARKKDLDDDNVETEYETDADSTRRSASSGSGKPSPTQPPPPPPPPAPRSAINPLPPIRKADTDDDTETETEGERRRVAPPPPPTKPISSSSSPPARAPPPPPKPGARKKDLDDDNVETEYESDVKKKPLSKPSAPAKVPPPPATKAPPPPPKRSTSVKGSSDDDD